MLDDPPAALSIEDVLVGLALTTELEHVIPLGRQVVRQTQRRVFWKQRVPATEKLVSIFEPHTDIIIKDRRETLLGHKLCPMTGKSGLVLDCVVLSGNPADSTLGLGRCTWRSLASFEAYTWASVLSANLLMLSRHILSTE